MNSPAAPQEHPRTDLQPRRHRRRHRRQRPDHLRRGLSQLSRDRLAVITAPRCPVPPADQLDEFYGPNAGYALELLERDQAAVGDSRCQIGAQTPELRASAEVSAAAAAAALAQSIRLFGHRGAHLDPLGSEPPGDPQLDYGAHGLTEDDLARLPASVVGGAVGRANLANAARGDPAAGADLLRHHRLRVRPRRGPGRARLAARSHRGGALPTAQRPVDERELLDRLTEVSAFERFLHRAYPGQTRFSIEGLGMLIPMLDELIADAAAHGTRSILLGMAHRGRLNVLAHVLGKPYARILAEFEGREPLAPRRAVREHRRGLGRRRQVPRRRAPRALPATAQRHRPRRSPWSWRPTPAISSSSTRSSRAWPARPTRTASAPGRRCQDEAASLAVLIHGDAVVPRPGRRRRDAQPVAPARLPHRRHAPHHRQQPARLHHRAARGPLDAVRQRPGQGLRDPDRARQRRRSRSPASRRSGWRSAYRASSARTS